MALTNQAKKLSIAHRPLQTSGAIEVSGSVPARQQRHEPGFTDERGVCQCEPDQPEVVSDIGRHAHPHSHH